MDFRVEGPWNTDKYCRPPWLATFFPFFLLATQKNRMKVEGWGGGMPPSIPGPGKILKDNM